MDWLDFDFELRDPFPDLAFPFPDLDPPPPFPREAWEEFALFFLDEEDPDLEDDCLDLDFVFPDPFPEDAEDDGAPWEPDPASDDVREAPLPCPPEDDAAEEDDPFPWGEVAPPLLIFPSFGQTPVLTRWTHLLQEDLCAAKCFLCAWSDASCRATFCLLDE